MFEYDPTINIGNFWVAVIFWVVVFIIAINETSNKNRRGK